MNGPSVINTDRAEKNGDLFIFKLDDVYAYGKKFNVRQFAKSLTDPECILLWKLAGTKTMVFVSKTQRFLPF
jgi:hypothetical protein